MTTATTPTSVEPFGDADAARADIFDPKKFISFTGRRFRSGLGMRPDDGDIRVIVGGKGAGKTIYLRRLQTTLSQNQSLYVDDWRNRPPVTRLVLDVWSWSTSVTDCRQRWSRLWRRAIFRSLVSHLLKADRLRNQIPAGVANRLRRDFPELLPDFEGRSSIVSQVEAIVREHPGREALDAFLHNPRWEFLENHVIDAVEDLPAMYFFLDALDEEFETAPSQWLDCQVGLLRQVLELRANQRLGGQLHLIIGVRDLVYSTTQDSEHASRFTRTPGIRYLRWDWDAIVYFLEGKLETLDQAEWMLDLRADDPLERWLGMSVIYNVKRGREEVLRDYILRHTRSIPRDVIQMGNALCGCIDVAVDNGDGCLTQETVRNTVAEVSRESGQEQLRIVSNHIVADLMPREALKHDYLEFYMDLLDLDPGAEPEDVGRAYQRTVFNQLCAALAELLEDRVTSRRLEHFATTLAKLGDVDVLSILWQHRLLGYVDGRSRLNDPVVFYGVARDDSLELPQGHAHYALHPILIDAIKRLRGVGATVQL